MEKKRTRNLDKKVLDEILRSMKEGMFIQKTLDDFNYGKRSFQTKDTAQTVSIAVAVFISGSCKRTHYFGKNSESVATIQKGMEKGVLLVDSPNQFRSASVVVGRGGAL